MHSKGKKMTATKMARVKVRDQLIQLEKDLIVTSESMEFLQDSGIESVSNLKRDIAKLIRTIIKSREVK
jgi:hypothetical protein